MSLARYVIDTVKIEKKVVIISSACLCAISCMYIFQKVTHISVTLFCFLFPSILTSLNIFKHLRGEDFFKLCFSYINDFLIYSIEVAKMKI